MIANSDENQIAFTRHKENAELQSGATFKKWPISGTPIPLCS